MPFIITTTPGRIAPPPARCRFGQSHTWLRRLDVDIDDCTVCRAISDEREQSVVAVATLDEAREHAFGTMANDSIYSLPLAARISDSIHALTDVGGTIGPLPDGTTIDVQPTLWGHLWDGLTLDTRPAAPMTVDEWHAHVLDRYNAA